MQQFMIGMHSAPHSFCMEGQLHEPPAPLQLCPATVQSVLSQHWVVRMQLDEAVHFLKPEVQVHRPPTDGHTWPTIAEQSLLAQQVPSLMHCPTGLPATVLTQGCCPLEQMQLPVPGSQNCPV